MVALAEDPNDCYRNGNLVRHPPWKQKTYITGKPLALVRRESEVFCPPVISVRQFKREKDSFSSHNNLPVAPPPYGPDAQKFSFRGYHPRNPSQSNRQEKL